MVAVLVCGTMFFNGNCFALSADAAGKPLRIISMIPVGTEILFDLGLGDQVIGVTKFCDWPKEALAKPKLSDLRDLNLEMMVSLKPDLLVVSDLQPELQARMDSLGFRTVPVRQGSVAQVYESILAVAKACGVEAKGRKRVEELTKRVVYLRGLTQNHKRPTVLISVGRDLTRERFADSYFAGPSTFYNELLTMSGGTNVLNKANTRVLTYPQLSIEGVIHLNPDVILDLVAGHGYGAPAKGQNIKGQWDLAKGVKAVDTGRVYVIADSVVLRPGPRFPQIMERFIRVLHPDVRIQK